MTRFLVVKDVHDYCKSCDACQRKGGLVIQSFTKLVTSFLEELDFDETGT
jgi:hypothetical protein